MYHAAPPLFQRLGGACASAAATLVLTALLAVPSLSRGATLVWDGGGGNNNWSTGDNWSGTPDNTSPANPAPAVPTDNTTLPAGVDVISFAGTTRPTSNVDTAWYIDALRFETGATAFNLTGSTITLRPSNGADHDGRYFLLNRSGQTQTISNNLVVLPAATAGASTGSGIHVGGAANSIVLNGTLHLNGTSGFRITSTSDIGFGGSVTFNNVISSTGGSDFVAINSGAVAVFNATNTFTKGLVVWNGTAKAGVDSLKDQAGAFGAAVNSPIGIGHGSSGGASILTTAGVEIGRDFVITRNTLNGGYIFGGESAHTSNYTGIIYNGTDAGAGTAVTLTAATNGRVNVNTVFRRINATSGSLGEDTLTKTGNGIVALTGVSTYSGATNVNAGTLLVNGTISASTAVAKNVIVSTTAALGGSGTINRDVILNGAATLTPGDINSSSLSTAANFTINGNLSLNSSSNVLNFDLGTTSDKVTVNGNLLLAGSLNILNSGGFGAGTYDLFSYTGSLTYTPGALTVNSTPNSALTYSIDTSTANVVRLLVTPEPGRAVLLMLGISALAFRRTRAGRTLA